MRKISKRSVGETPSCRCRAKHGYRHMGFRLSSAYGGAICVQKKTRCGKNVTTKATLILAYAAYGEAIRVQIKSKKRRKAL